MQQVSTAAASRVHTRRIANGIVSTHQPAALRENEGATDGYCEERVFTGEGGNKVVEALCCRGILMGHKKVVLEVVGGVGSVASSRSSRKLNVVRPSLKSDSSPDDIRVSAQLTIPDATLWKPNHLDMKPLTVHSLVSP